MKKSSPPVDHQWHVAAKLHGLLGVLIDTHRQVIDICTTAEHCPLDRSMTAALLVHYTSSSAVSANLQLALERTYRITEAN